MKSFQFNQTSNNESFEKILKYRKRRIVKQQVVFAVILAVLLLLLGVYIYNKVVYTEFDGYVSSDVAKQRAPDDIFIKRVYVKVGSFVIPGDTLYSFVYLKPLVDNANMNTESDVSARLRDMNLRYSSILAEIKVLRVTIANLRKQIAVENHNIAFGLSSNSHKLDLQRELSKTEEELRAKHLVLNAIVSERAQIQDLFSHEDDSHKSNVYLDKIMLNNTDGYNSLIKYRLATDSTIVTEISCVEGTCLMHGDDIMSQLPINMHKGNHSVWAYVPTDELPKVKRNVEVDIIYNENVKLKGHFDLIGVRTEEMPENLRSNFARQSRVSMVSVVIHEGQEIPLWALADGTPVTIRKNNFYIEDKQKNIDTDRLRFHTGHGLTPQSKIIFDRMRRKKDNRRYFY